MPDVFGGALEFEMDLKIQEIEKRLKSLDGQIAGLAKNAEKNGNKLEQSFNSAFKKVAAGLGTYFTARAMAGFTGEVAKTRGEFEQLEVAFTTMLGSKEKADELMKQVVEFASTTPFQLKDVAAGTKQLLAYGVASKDIIPTLKSLGDVSAGLSVPMERLILNYGQVRTQGKLTGRELRDFSMAGVPLVAELAKNLNVSEKAIQDMVSAGNIGFKEVEKAFQSMTSEGGRFADLMDKQSKTITGQASNIADTWDKIYNAIGKRGEQTLKNTQKQYGALVSTLYDLVDIPVADTIAKEQIELNKLVLQLQDANTSEEDRKKIIDEIQKNYPGFIKNVDLEKASNEQLAEALNKVNDEYINRIVLAQAEEKLQKEVNKENKIAGDLAKQRNELLTRLAQLTIYVNEQAKSGAYQLDTTLLNSTQNMEEKANILLMLINDIRDQGGNIAPGTMESINLLQDNIHLLDEKLSKQKLITQAIEDERNQLKEFLELGKKTETEETVTVTSEFDVETFEANLKATKQLYMDYLDQKKISADKAVLDDYKRQIDTNITYEQYLRKQLALYKDNIEARKVIGLELASIMEKAQKEEVKAFKDDFINELNKVNDEIKPLSYSYVKDLQFQQSEAYKKIFEDSLRWTNKTLQEKIRLTRESLAEEKGLSEAMHADLNMRLAELNDMLIGQYADGIRDVGAIIGELADVIGNKNSTLSQSLLAIADISQGVAGAIQGFASGNILQGIQGTISVVSSLIKLFDTSLAKEEQRLEFNRKIEQSIRSQGELLQMQLDIADRLIGAIKVEKTLSNIRDTERAIDALLRKIKGGGVGGSYEIKSVVDVDNETFLEQLRLRIDLVQDLYDSYLAGNKAAAYSEAELNKLKEIEKQYYSLIEQQQKYNELITGSTYDSILSGITDAFSDGILSVEEFASSFEDIMKKAIMKSFQTQFLEKQLSGWYDQFAESTQGGLTEAEIEALRNSLQVIVSDAQKGLNDIINVSGIDFAGGSVAKESALAGAIKGITEDTANVLAGQFNAMRINGIQQLQVAQNSLTVLSRIEGNTRYNMLLRDILIEIKNQNANSLLNDRANGR